MKKRLWFCLLLLFCIYSISYAQELNLGNGVGSSVGQAALGLVKGSKAVSGIKLSTETPTETFSISGKIIDKKNKPIKGVLITLSGDNSATTKTGKKGTYRFSSLESGDYTIAPSLAGYKFKPKSQNITITTENKKKVNFTGKKIAKTPLAKNDVLATETWPYGDADADGFYTVDGYKMKFYDASGNAITNMATNFASASKIEVKVEVSYTDGSVNGSIFATTGVPISYPLVFNGTLNLTMNSVEFGKLTGTVEILDCTLDSGATFFSSGSMDVTTDGSLTSMGFDVTYSANGTLDVTDNKIFEGTLSVTYEAPDAPIPVSDTVKMTLTVKPLGHGSYSSDDQYVGSGTF